VPRSVVFAGKAAPGYVMAKGIIKLINNVGRVVNSDKAMRGRSRWCSCRTTTCRSRVDHACGRSLGADLDGGMEASGTGNMKLSLNGALTIGTLDGANIEIREQVGADKHLHFRAHGDEVAEYVPGYSRRKWRAQHGVMATLELIDSGYFTPAISPRQAIVTGC